MKIETQGIIDGVRRDKWGAWKIIIEIPQSEATKAAALGTMVDTVFTVSFEPQESESVNEPA